MKNLLVESLEIAKNSFKEKKDEKEAKWNQEKEKRMKEKEEKLKKEEELKKKMEEEKKKENDKTSKNTKSSANIKVAVSRGSNRGKRMNRTRLMQHVDVPKNKKKNSKKPTEKEENKHAEEVEEDHKEGEESKEDETPPELTDEELFALNSQIYTDIYSMIIIKLQDDDLLKNISQRFSIKIDDINIKPALKKICRIITKEKLKPVIDFKKPLELKNCSFSIKDLEDPEVTIMKEIEEKVLFLLEVNPSIDLNSQILESDSGDFILDRLKSSKEMNLLKSSDKYSGFGDASDSDLSLQRSKSAIVNPVNKGQFLKGKARKAARRSLMKKGIHNTRHADLKNESLHSSSFESVFSFITNPTIKNFKGIKESIDAHFATADNRLQGFDHLNKLLKLLKNTNQSKSILAPMANSLEFNPFVNIEASGIERLRKVNNKIKETLRNLISIFISDYNKLKLTVSDFIKTRLQNSSRSSKASSSDEVFIISQIRAILECLNDMIIILSDNPAKDAFILHIVIEFTQGDSKFSEFFTNLIGLILDTNDSLIILNKSHLSENLIAQTQTAAKLLLNKFIIKDTEDSQISLEAHILLQETLLDNIVNMLKEEMKCNKVEDTSKEDKKKNSLQKFLATKYQRIVTLFLLLNTVLKMSYSFENVKDEIRNGILDIVAE